MGSINYSGRLRKLRSRLFLRADVGSFDGYATSTNMAYIAPKLIQQLIWGQ
jgi:hypothetical protein